MDKNVIKISEMTGAFAENKDTAKSIREDKIIPLLANNQEIILDFKGVDSTTQSFIHALISDLIRKFGTEVLDRVAFKNCNEIVQKIVAIVVDYMQGV